MKINNLIKLFVEKVTGYWIFNAKYLPIGTDLRIDLTKRFNYKNIKTIFDVGANIGQTFQQFKAYFPNATIYCFEPINSTFKKLEQNLSSKQDKVLENFAFGEISGKKKVKLFDEWNVLNSLNEELMNNSDDAKSQEVEIKTIDEYCKEKNILKIDLLKIDTEGYEINVLKGAIDFLNKKHISFVLCEIGFLKKNIRNTNFSELSEFLAEYDYYFIAMYNGSNEFWNKGLYFGNALFGHKELNF